MNRISRSWQPTGDHKLLYEFLPDDTSRQRSGFRCAIDLLEAFPESTQAPRILDLGCGTGDSYDRFYSQFKKIRWLGLDITDSREVAQRTTNKLPLCSYDGVHIPIADNAIDLAYSRQVFEHVRHPENLLREVHRILKPKGHFVGSTSHLEPFHSRSYWNYTPYGFCVLLKDAGFRSIQIWPGIDSLTLIGRRWLAYIGAANLLNAFFEIESPVNAILEVCLRLFNQPTQRRAALKLLFSGQFCFLAQK